jgi:hypothetical protein
MVARGVAEMTSKISSEDEEDDASLWRKKLPAVRDFRGGSLEMMSMDFVSQEHGVPHNGPKDSNAGG